jgi:hypothetical protein
MMSGTPLETCWAFNERYNNKLYYKVASCWLFLLIHTTMLHGSMNITDAKFFEFIEYRSTCFGRSFRPSSGAQDCTYNFRYMSISCPLVSCQQTCMTYTCSCMYSFGLLMMDGKTVRNMYYVNLKICASGWFYFRNISRCSTVTWT